MGQIHLRLDPDVLRTLRVVAAKRDLRVSRLVVLIIGEWLAGQKIRAVKVDAKPAKKKETKK